MELLETNREPFSRGMNTSLCVAYGSSSASSTMAVPCGLAALFTVGHITPALAEELARLAENQPMTGPRLAAILRSERTTWNTLLAHSISSVTPTSCSQLMLTSLPVPETLHQT
jgi:hypothetical protein